MIFGHHHIHIVKDRFDHTGIEFFGTESVSAIDNQRFLDKAIAALHKCGGDICI